MKAIYIKTAILGALFAALLGGCAKDKTNVPRSPETEKVAVVIKGGMKGVVPSRSRGVIDPQAGLPPVQLDVNIITVNYTTADPLMDQPGPAAWQGQTADVTRGFFGENAGYTAAHNNNPLIPEGDREGFKPDNGRIEYTDEDGSAVQKVFYDEGGEYYFVRIFHPYENTEFTSSMGTLGASIIFNEVDGNQDILCSNLGWGNIYNPEVETAAGKTGLVFSHMLSLFRLYITAENDQVVNGTPPPPVEGSTIIGTGQYGQISNARIRFQPGALIADAMDGEIIPLPGDPLEKEYFANEFPTPFSLESKDIAPFPGRGEPRYAGYIMVLPGQSEYRLEVLTERMWAYGDLKFAEGKEPLPGKVYDITLEMKESYELKVVPSDPTDWWMDHVFD